MSSDMLNLWAEKLVERGAIKDFLDWCWDEKHLELRSYKEKHVCGIPNELLDEYHGINQHQLEKERRDLLENWRVSQ